MALFVPGRGHVGRGGGSPSRGGRKRKAPAATPVGGGGGLRRPSQLPKAPPATPVGGAGGLRKPRVTKDQAAQARNGGFDYQGGHVPGDLCGHVTATFPGEDGPDTPDSSVGRLQDPLRSIAQKIIAESGCGPSAITSGWRSVQRQAELRARYEAGKGALAARPGQSKHNHGLAIDVSMDCPKAHEIARREGLVLTVPGEPWHYELPDGHSVQASDQWHAEQGMEFDLGGSQSPDQVLTNRMDTIASIIGIDPMADMPIIDPGPAEMDPFSPAPSTPTDQPLCQDAWAPEGRNFGGDVDQWRDVAIAALRYTNSPMEWLPSLMRRMQQESSGDPNAVNRWDINAQRGDPSRGLMQTIGATFNDHAGELAHRGINDPFANIVASIRYANSRYGSAPRGWNRKGGY